MRVKARQHGPHGAGTPACNSATFLFLQTTLAVLGIVGNSIASVIISRKEMRNAFNLLLVSLACFDSTYLFGSILESIRWASTSRCIRLHLYIINIGLP